MNTRKGIRALHRDWIRRVPRDLRLPKKKAFSQQSPPSLFSSPHSSSLADEKRKGLI
jgi:hypothetical protein